MRKRERAEKIYVECFGQNGSLDDDAIAVLCKEHQELGDELVAVHADCQQIGAILNTFTADPQSLVERMQLEGELSLRGETASDSDPPSSASGSASGRLLEQLASARAHFSRYNIKGEIAHGAMGRILEVYDRDLRRDLAMKVSIRGQMSVSGTADSKDVKHFGRLLEEAQVTGQLEHPGVVPVYELGLDTQGRVYFTMPVIRGADLRTVMKDMRSGQSKSTRSQLLSVLLSVCETLAYAHDRGVVHRDIKPANIMVGAFGEVYVMDWGLARVRGRSSHVDIKIVQDADSLDTSRRDTAEETPQSPLMTGDGDVVGTPAYMPLEQALGDVEAVDARSDVYAVGAMLYELLTGRRPYQVPGQDRSSVSVLRALRDGPPTPISELAPDVNPELRAICEKAMAREQGDRYPDARAFASNLRAFLDDRVVDVFEGGALAELRKWVRRNRSTAAALVGLLLVLISAGVIVALVESNRVSEVQAAKIDVEAERDEKEALLDVRTAPVLLEDINRYRPSLAGIDTMRRGVATAEDLISRRSNHENLLSLGALPWPHLPIRELEQHLARLDELEEILPRLQARIAAAVALASREDDWSEVIADVRQSDRLDRMHLAKQRGLAPLRKDPESGLWEFWHVLSGERPEFEEGVTGYELREETGLVLVLIPGGRFNMGSPVSEVGHAVDEVQHPVTVRPFFVSKYETSQGQWTRATGFNPSYYDVGVKRGEVVTSLLHPVENVTWFDADGLAKVLDLRLPSEEEWEFACRAGTAGPYSWGYDTLGAEGLENFADASWLSWVFGTAPGVVARVQPAPWDDGYPVTSLIGSYSANQLGLHDMHGNVAEWTSGIYALDYEPIVSSDPAELARQERVARGGNHMFGPSFGRSAMRQSLRPFNTNKLLSVRLARSVVD